MRILYITPDCSQTGAPQSLYDVMRITKEHHDCNWMGVCGEAGPMYDKLAGVSELIAASTLHGNTVKPTGDILKHAYWQWLNRGRSNALECIYTEWTQARRCVNREKAAVKAKNALCDFNPHVIYSNTICNQEFLSKLMPAAPVVMHLRELESVVLSKYRKQNPFEIYPVNKCLIVCESQREICLNYGLREEQISLVPVGINIEEVRRRSMEDMPAEFSKWATRFKYLVVGSGYMSMRKGVVDFLLMAELIEREHPNIAIGFLWVGGGGAEHRLKKEIEYRGLSERIHITGQVENPFPYFKRGSLFLQTAYEDPCPRVVFEATVCELPVTALNGKGGVTDFCNDGCGVILDRSDLSDSANQLISLLHDKNGLAEMQSKAVNKVKKMHRIEEVAEQVFSEMMSCVN